MIQYQKYNNSIKKKKLGKATEKRFLQRRHANGL